MKNLIILSCFLLGINSFSQIKGNVKNQERFEDFKQGRQYESDITSLWVKDIKSNTYLKKTDVGLSLLKTLDISDIIAYNTIEEYEISENFSTYIGVFGQNFERIDFHVYSASKLTNQNYELKLLMRQGTTIDTLAGHLKLIEAYEFPDFFDDENKQMFIFLYNFDFTSKNQVHGLTIKGTSSVAFYTQDKTARNFWSSDGTLSEYVRTFVGYYFDNKNNSKQNCIFSLQPAGLYTYLPFCESFYSIDKYDNPEYYFINDKYRPFGWQDYDYRNPKKEEWWK